MATFLAKTGAGKTFTSYQKGEVIFAQHDQADAIFYVQKGKLKLTVVSNDGKEAVVALLGVGDFLGEGCLAGQQVRMSTAAAMTECAIMRLSDRHFPATTRTFLWKAASTRASIPGHRR